MTGPIYKFPINNESFYKGTVVFTAIPSTPTSAAANDAIGKLIGTATSAIESTLGTTVSITAEEPPPDGTVIMYLPANLQFTDGVNYEQMDLGITGGALAKVAMTGAANAAAGPAGSSSLVDTILAGIETAAATSLMQLPGALGGAAVQQAAEFTAGVTFNPNRRTVFRNVAFRNFTMAFKLIPTSLEEANAITNIVQFFRSHIYPFDYQANGISFGYRYPYKFTIDLLYDGKQVATKILPSYCTAINTNYNPNNMAFIKGGYFSEIDLQISFIEERTLSQQDITDGGY